jgi:hypothetical protein
VTGQALGVNLFGRVLRGIEYLARVAATGHMVGTGTMATFATLVRGATLLIKGRFPVRCFLPRVIDIFVAGFAGLRAHVLGGIGGHRIGRWRDFGGSLRVRLGDSQGDSGKNKQGGKRKKSSGPGISGYSHSHAPLETSGF